MKLKIAQIVKRKCEQLNEKIIAVIDSNFAVVERNSGKIRLILNCTGFKPLTSR